MVAAAHEISGAGEFELIWRVPMARIGFYVAEFAKKHGVKHVGRKLDYAAALEYQRKKSNGGSTTSTN